MSMKHDYSNSRLPYDELMILVDVSIFRIEETPGHFEYKKDEKSSSKGNSLHFRLGRPNYLSDEVGDLTA